MKYLCRPQFALQCAFRSHMHIWRYECVCVCGYVAGAHHDFMLHILQQKHDKCTCVHRCGGRFLALLDVIVVVVAVDFFFAALIGVQIAGSLAMVIACTYWCDMPHRVLSLSLCVCVCSVYLFAFISPFIEQTNSAPLYSFPTKKEINPKRQRSTPITAIEQQLQKNGNNRMNGAGERERMKTTTKNSTCTAENTVTKRPTN